MDNVNWWVVARVAYSIVWLLGAFATKTYFHGKQEPVTTKSIIAHGIDELVVTKTVYQYPDNKWYLREIAAVVVFFALAIPMVLLWLWGL